MKIVIVGCGNVGRTLAEQLYQEGHNITVVDENEEKVRVLAVSYTHLTLPTMAVV